MLKESHKDPGSVRFVRGILYALLCTPLVAVPSFYYFLVSSKLFYFLALSQVLLMGLLWLWIVHKAWRPKCSLVLMFVLVYTLVVTIASVFGVNPLVSFWGSPERDVNTIVLLHLVAVFFGMVSVLRTRAHWNRLFFVSVMVALVCAGLFFITLVLRDSVPWYALTHGGSTLGNSSFFGAYLVFHIFFAGLLAISSRTRRTRHWMWLVTVVLALTLFATEAQTAALALAGGVVLFLGLVLAWQTQHRAKRAVGTFMIAGLALATMYVFIALLFSHSLVRGIVTARSTPARFILWEMAWEGFKDRPFLGWGSENFPAVFQTHYDPCLGSSTCGGEVWFDRSHNKVLDVLVETGVVGLATYIAIILAALRGIQIARSREQLNDVQASLLVALLATNFIQSLTVFDTLTGYLSWFVILGYIHTLSSTSKGESVSIYPAPHARVRPLLLLSFIPVVVLFFFVTFLPARSSIDTKAVFGATMLREHLAYYQKAVNGSPYGVDLRRSALSAQTATIILDLSVQDRERFSSLLIEELTLAEQGILDSIDHSPEFLRGYLDLVFVYQVWGRTFDASKFADAHRLAQMAIERFPRNPLAYWARVSLLLEDGDVEQALMIAQEALTLSPLVRDSLIRSLITVKFLEDPDMELELARRIVQSEPNLQSLVEAYLATDIQTRKIDLLFRFYYDAAI